MPLHRRLPKRGFTNIFRTEYTVVNLERIAELGVDRNRPRRLQEAGSGLEQEGAHQDSWSGELTSAITIHAHKFSKSAAEKIEKAGGKAVVLGGAAAAATA